MSGVVSGVGKLFGSVAKTVTNVGSSIMGVGASLFTGGAATGAGSMASGGFSGLSSIFGNSTLGSVIGGAVKQAGFGALLGGAVGAITGQGFGKGAMMGALGGAVTGGLTGYSQAQADPGGTVRTHDLSRSPFVRDDGLIDTGAINNLGNTQHMRADLGPDAAPTTGITTPVPPRRPADLAPSPAAGAPAAVNPGAAAQDSGGLFSGEMLAGLGQGLMKWQEQRAAAKQAELNRAVEREAIQARLQMEQMGIDERERETQRKVDSYRVGPEAYHQAPAGNPRGATAGLPTPAEKYAREPTAGRVRWVFNRETGDVERVAV